MMRGVNNTEETFWGYVQKGDGCWLWTGGRDKDGYGIFWWNGKNVRAHRFSRMITGEPIPRGKVSRHICNNPVCVKPEHVIEGSQKENIHDQLKSGRHSGLRYSDSLVRKIRDEYSSGKVSTRKLASKYGVSKSQVHMIVTNASRYIYKEKK